MNIRDVSVSAIVMVAAGTAITVFGAIRAHNDKKKFDSTCEPTMVYDPGEVPEVVDPTILPAEPPADPVT